MGYVGVVTAACLAKAGHQIIGVDVSQDKVDQINAGCAPIIEPGLPDLLSDLVAKGLIRASVDQVGSALETDASIVCVGTPPLESGRIDLTHVRRLCEVLGKALKEKKQSHLLILRSTMLPGSTRSLKESYFGEVVDSRQVSFVYCPEFLREGTALKDFEGPALQVIGTIDSAPNETARTLMGCTAWMSWEAAELVKYASNYWHALKVAFGNEIGRVSKHLGIDARNLMAEFVKDHKLNISDYYMRPGMPFGGSCLPKDVSALQAFARQEGVTLPVLESVLSSNQAHLDLLLSQVLRTGKKKVLLLGLTFKPDTDDLRGSPLVAMCESLLGRGYELAIYDPLLNMEGLRGANLREIHRRMPHLANLLISDVALSIRKTELLVVAHKNIELSVLKNNINKDQLVLDLVGWQDLNKLDCIVEGICW